MIYVDPVQRGAVPWRGGAFSHLISDTSVGELLEFATRLGLRSSWFQHRSPTSMPHFDIAPEYRARAIAAGAVSATLREFVDAMRRYRERNPLR